MKRAPLSVLGFEAAAAALWEQHCRRNRVSLSKTLCTLTRTAWQGYSIVSVHSVRARECNQCVVDVM